MTNSQNAAEPPLEWSSKFSLGSQVIDAHHCKLIGYINELEKAIKNGSATPEKLSVIADHLLDYTDYHFSEEERLMRIHHYPELDEHREEHAAFLREVLHFRQEVLRGGDPGDAIRMAKYLRKWLIQHILIIDKEYAIFFAEHGIKL